MTVATMERKAFPFEIKAVDEKGSFTGYASVFNNIDSYGDVMVPKSFERSLSERGLPYLSFEHAWTLGPIGVVKAAAEDEFGLRIDGELFLDSDLPSRLHRAMKSGWKAEMSFAFYTRDSEMGEQDGQEVRFVKDVDLLEAAIVVKGANDEAGVLSVRSASEEVLKAFQTLGNIAANASLVRRDVTAEQQASFEAEAAGRVEREARLRQIAIEAIRYRHTYAA